MNFTTGNFCSLNIQRFSLFVAFNTLDGNICMAFWLLIGCFPSFLQVRGHNFKLCMHRARCQGWGDWMAVAGELTSNMKVKWQAGHNKVSIGVSPLQTSQEQSGRKRPSQLLADVSGRMFHWQTRGRHRSLMVPLVTSNLHLAARENCNTPVKTSVCNLRHPTQMTLVLDRIFWPFCW